MNFKSEFIREIYNRGFIYQYSDIYDLDNLMSSKKISAYIGFDITSDSLHVGSLVQLMLLNWLDYYDHTAIALVGGGTTLVGDPSGKDETRKIKSKEEIDNNINKISKKPRCQILLIARLVHLIFTTAQTIQFTAQDGHGLHLIPMLSSQTCLVKFLAEKLTGKNMIWFLPVLKKILALLE